MSKPTNLNSSADFSFVLEIVHRFDDVWPDIKLHDFA